jgi:hypothetical protein
MNDFHSVPSLLGFAAESNSVKRLRAAGRSAIVNVELQKKAAITIQRRTRKMGVEV